MEKKDIHHRFPFFLAVLFLFLLAVMVAGAWQYYQRQERLFKTKVRDELSAVANLKVEQIVGWRKERLADADLLSRGGLLIGKNAPKYNIRDKFRRISPMLAIYKKDFGYYSLIVTDIAGRVLENIGDTSRAPQYVDTAAILLVVAEKKTKIVDFYLCPACGRVHLDVIVPVFEGEIGSVVAGVVVLRRDPADFHFPLIQSWPTPSRTSETLLLRQEGDSILYLNELRNRKGTALRFRLPLNIKDLPAARVVRGGKGFMEGKDYRGVEVFAVGRHIPDSPWYIIAKVDKEEVLAPLRAAGRNTLFIGGLGIAILLSLLVMWWMAYDRRSLEKQIAAEAMRRKAEEGLLESENKYRELFYNAQIGMFRTKMDGSAILEVNQNLLDVFGFTREEMLASPTTMRWAHPEDREKMASRLRADGIVTNLEAAFVTKSGEIRDFLISVKPYTEQGILEGSGLDITDRKKAEEALQESEKRLSEAQKMAQLGNWDWDIKTGNVEWSDEVYHIFQLDPKNFTPQIDSILAFSPWPEDHERDKELIRKAMESREKGNYVQRFLRPDKSTGYYHSTFQGKYDNEGNLISIVGTILDITDRKQTEQEIVRLNNELLLKNTELEQLVYIASHDLRSPLVNVQGFSKEMGLLVKELATITLDAGLTDKRRARLSDIVSKEFPEAQNYILASVIKMDALLKGLLKLSRLGRACVNLQKINMNDLLISVIKTVEFQIQQCNARVETGSLPFCTGDPAQVDQVFTNLIDNAIKYLSPDRAGIIRITGKSGNGISEYCVEDNGIGIAPEHQPKAFEIFHRLNPQMCEGEGLGLAIVKKIVSRLNGNVRLESEAGRGSRFLVTLPGA
jgi:PAS domain S-box-containing protein